MARRKHQSAYEEKKKTPPKDVDLAIPVLWNQKKLSEVTAREVRGHWYNPKTQHLIIFLGGYDKLEYKSVSQKLSDKYRDVISFNTFEEAELAAKEAAMPDEKPEFDIAAARQREIERIKALTGR